MRPLIDIDHFPEYEKPQKGVNLVPQLKSLVWKVIHELSLTTASLARSQEKIDLDAIITEVMSYPQVEEMLKEYSENNVRGAILKTLSNVSVANDYPQEEASPDSLPPVLDPARQVS